MAIVVLDPGHGGSDPGATYKNHMEKTFTLEIALAAYNYLRSNFNASVYLTRNSDTTVSLTQRATYANKLKADIFVSVHINAGGGTGFESFIYTGAGAVTKNRQHAIHSTMAGFYKSLEFPDRGMKRANFSVLKKTVMSAVLLENLFLDNTKDLNQLLKPGFTRQAGEKIGHGIAGALNLAAKTSPSPGPPTPPPLEQPGQPVVWDPQAEIERLKKDGLVANKYKPSDPVNWGQFATVLNRLRDSWRS